MTAVRSKKERGLRMHEDLAMVATREEGDERKGNRPGAWFDGGASHEIRYTNSPSQLPSFVFVFRVLRKCYCVVLAV